MQNYEELFAALQPAEKGLKDAANTVSKLQKNLAKATDSGSLAEAAKIAASLEEAQAELAARIGEVRAAIGGFDVARYFSEGDFTRQLLDECASRGIDVQGEKGVYEMFPYKLRVFGEGEHVGEVWLDRKKLPSVRPSYVAETVRAGQQKLYASAFKEGVFMNELADAYETCCLKNNVHIGSTQILSKIYKYMAPTARARKDYDFQAYAFDLARLFEKGSEYWVTKAGVQYQFGTSRDGKNAVRVLNSAGVEFFISTLRPLGGDGS